MTFVLEMSLSIKVFSVCSYREHNTNMLHQTYLSQALNVLGFFFVCFFFPDISIFYSKCFSLCVTSEELSSRILLGVGWLSRPLRPSGFI